MENPSNADIGMMFNSTVVSYGDRLVYFKQMINEHMAQILDLDTGEEFYVTFDLNMFKAPKKRIGYVNTERGCFYVERVPVRRYKVGLSAENTKVHLDENSSDNERMRAQSFIKASRNPMLVHAYNNVYPEFETAVALVGDTKRACAFDKQFAITERFDILYKGSHVGKLPRGANKVEAIVFKDGSEHLKNIIGNSFKINL